MKRSWRVARGAWCVVLLLPVVLTACGHKGRLKTPSQVEAEQQKKAQKEAKKTEQEKKKETPSPLEGEGWGGGHSSDAASPPPNLPPQGREE